MNKLKLVEVFNFAHRLNVLQKNKAGDIVIKLDYKNFTPKVREEKKLVFVKDENGKYTCTTENTDYSDMEVELLRYERVGNYICSLVCEKTISIDEIDENEIKDITDDDIELLTILTWK